MARIAVIGPGAIGATFAAWLAHTGRHEVWICARRPLTGLTVTTPSAVLNAPIPVYTRPDDVPAADWVLVATKAYDADSAAIWFPRLGASGARFAILQNGVEHRERFERHLPAERIVPVVVDLPAERSAPDRVRQRGPGRLTVADDAAGRDFAALFAGTDLTVTTTSDFRSAVWRKLCLNAAGVVPALLLQPASVMRGDGIAEVVRDIVREAIAVGRAEGAVLPDEIADDILRAYRAAPADSINSLHADRLAGRPTEIDARNGVIVRFGRRHGIPTPANRMAFVLISELTRPPSVPPPRPG